MGLTDDDETQPLDPTLARALSALDSADATLAEPRPYEGAGDAWDAQARASSERAAPVVLKRAEAIIRKVRTQTDPAAPVRRGFDGVAFGDEIVSIVKGYVDRENALLRARVIDLEVRLAQTEARLASVEFERETKMTRRFFDDERAEVEAHIATVDLLIGLFRERIVYLEALKTRAERLQFEMQRFCDRVDDNEARLQAADMDASGTHRAPPTPN